MRSTCEVVRTGSGEDGTAIRAGFTTGALAQDARSPAARHAAVTPRRVRAEVVTAFSLRAGLVRGVHVHVLPCGVVIPVVPKLPLGQPLWRSQCGVEHLRGQRVAALVPGAALVPVRRVHSLVESVQQLAAASSGLAMEAVWMTRV